MKKVYKSLFSYLIITLGTFITALTLNTILLPNGIIDGGITGISIILSTFSPVRVSVFLIVLNIPLIVIGYRNLGINFTIKATYAICLYSIALKLTEHINPVFEDKFLATIAGGVCIGLGIGLVIFIGGCLDGADIMAILIDKKTELSVGQAVLLFNIVIFSASSIFFGWEKAIYSMIAYFISSKIIDMVTEGVEKTKVAIITTTEDSDIPKLISKELGRTVTSWSSAGHISGSNTTLYVVITLLEIARLKEVLATSKSSSFVTIIDANEIVGTNIKRNH